MSDPVGQEAEEMSRGGSNLLLVYIERPVHDKLNVKPCTMLYIS